MDSPVKIIGLENAMRTLNELPAKIEQKYIRGALSKAGKEFAKGLAATAPEAPQHYVNPKMPLPSLKDSIKLRGGGNQRGILKRKIIGNYYASFLERGTFKMGAQPFIRPFVDGQGQQLLQQVCDLIGKRIEEAGPKIDE